MMEALNLDAVLDLDFADPDVLSKAIDTMSSGLTYGSDDLCVNIVNDDGVDTIVHIETVDELNDVLNKQIASNKVADMTETFVEEEIVIEEFLNSAEVVEEEIITDEIPTSVEVVEEEIITEEIPNSEEIVEEEIITEEIPNSEEIVEEEIVTEEIPNPILGSAEEQVITEEILNPVEEVIEEQFIAEGIPIHTGEVIEEQTITTHVPVENFSVESDKKLVEDSVVGQEIISTSLLNESHHLLNGKCMDFVSKTGLYSTKGSATQT